MGQNFLWNSFDDGLHPEQVVRFAESRVHDHRQGQLRCVEILGVHRVVTQVRALGGV